MFPPCLDGVTVDGSLAEAGRRASAMRSISAHSRSFGKADASSPSGDTPDHDATVGFAFTAVRELSWSG